MESLVPASAFTASSGLVHVAGAVLCVLALAATGLVVAGTAAEREGRLLASGRVMCVLLTGSLAAVGFLDLLARWTLVVACAACALALFAAALRHGQGRPLRGYLGSGLGEAEPAWWPAFERGFRRYAGAPRREQNPLRRAVSGATSTGAEAGGRGDLGRPSSASMGRRP
jgi:hypothetical protein